MNMGFTEEQAKDALDGSGGDLERAVPWELFFGIPEVFFLRFGWFLFLGAGIVPCIF